MRVTTGSARGRVLKSVPGDTTRPITDIVKQAVFNILQDDVQGSSWLDLFAGTGAVGIKALSRGAADATFIDNAPEAIDTIKDNLTSTRLIERSRVVRQDAFRFLRGAPREFDFIYVAPPQYAGLWAKALQALDAAPGWLGEDGEIIVQIDPSEFQALTLKNFELVDERKYGKTLVCFYQRPEIEV